MLGPFATASRRTPHCHSPGVATVARTPPAHRCPQQRRRRQRVTEGTAMAPENGPKDSQRIQISVDLTLVRDLFVSTSVCRSLKNLINCLSYQGVSVANILSRSAVRVTNRQIRLTIETPTRCKTGRMATPHGPH